jgi:nucleoside-diphosphate-sugar epimerase
MVCKGTVPVVGRGTNVRSLSYVDNVVQGLILASTVESAAGSTYWIADARPYPMSEVLNTIERIAREEFGRNCRRGRVRLPRVVCEVARAADAITQGCGFYDARVHVLSLLGRNIACRIDKARRELGYAPTVSLEEGMQRSLAAAWGPR